MKHARINSSQPNSAVSYKVLSDRAKLSFDILGAISGGEFDDNNEKHLLVVKLMQQSFSFSRVLLMRQVSSKKVRSLSKMP